MRWSIDLAAKAAGDEVEVAARGCRPRRERPRKPLADLIQTLRHRREDRLRLGPAADGEIEPLAGPLDPPRQALPRAMLKLAELGEQLVADRHRHLRGGGRGRRAAVGGVVDQRGVRLMARRRRSAGSAIRRRRGPPPPR